MKILPYCWLATGMLALAVLFKMPYGYYQLLRFVVCGTAGLCAFKAYQAREQLWLFLAGAIALIFNPFVPIHFHRDTWQVLNFVAAVLMPMIGYGMWQVLGFVARVLDFVAYEFELGDGNQFKAKWKEAAPELYRPLEEQYKAQQAQQGPQTAAPPPAAPARKPQPDEFPDELK